MNHKYYVRHIGEDNMIEISLSSLKHALSGPPIPGGRDPNASHVLSALEKLHNLGYKEYWNCTYFAVRQPNRRDRDDNE